MSKKEKGRNKTSEILTSPVPYSIWENTEDITINTHNFIKTSNFSREEIISKALIPPEKGEALETIKNYKKCIDLEVDDYYVFRNYGMLLIGNEKYVEAERVILKAIKIKPNEAFTYLNLSVALKKLGRLEESESNIRKFIEIEPSMALGHLYLSNTLRDLGKLEQAEISARKAIELKPDFADSYMSLGICLFFKGNKESALNYLEKSNTIMPRKENKILSSIFIQEKYNITYKELEHKTSHEKLRSIPNPLILNRPVEKELIECLYNIKPRDQEKYQGPTYGNAMGSDFNFFDTNKPIINAFEKDLKNIISNSLESDILIYEAFFTIFSSGGGLTIHNHLSDFDKINGLNIQSRKYSLVYYLSVGDQNCDEPGILKLKDPNQDILPTNGLIIMFPSKRNHSVFYKGRKDRVIIGVNLYSI